MSACGTRSLVVVALLIACAAGARAAWIWQANAYKTLLAQQADEYGKRLAEKDRAHGLEREKAAAAALDRLDEQRKARSALEARLQQQAQTNWKQMNDAKKTQDRLRDRFATADLRLSVLLDASSLSTQGCDGGLREATGTGGLVHGAVRAQLDQAHSQRIVAITDEGDRGLIALQACQGYVRETTR